jgi:pimeloyl-ACP methyl ester carboxylesterase
MSLQIDGIEVHHTILGDGTSPPLLFLHGWGVGHEAYMPLLAQLAATHTVYAPDMPGFGKTPEPPEPWDVEKYAGFAAAYCEANGLAGPVCMGHSNGGRVLLRLLSMARPPITPPKVVLFNSAGLKPKRGLKVSVKVYTFKIIKFLLRPFPKLLERYRANKGSADYRASSPVMKATMTKLLAADLSPELPAIKPPTLLIWGEGDTATPLSDGRKMERLLPDAGLAVLPGGHWAFLERLPHTMRILDSFL